MQTLNQILTLDQNYLLLGLIVLFFIMETAFNRPRLGSKLNHLFQNLLYQIIVIAMASLLGFMMISTFNWIESHHFGLFNWVMVPFWFKIIAGVFLVDMADYWTHRIDHRNPLLWRQHRVHHSDTDLDASTALRGFPTDLIFFTCGELLICVIFGLDILSLNIFLFLFLPITFFHHSNLNYPEWIDKVFGWLLVTPNYHKVHHEQNQFYTDSNYGTLFIIWDKLFGTFKTKPVEEIKYGLKEFEGNKKQSFLYLIKSPFANIERIMDDEGDLA
jgi:sterol desaturase/sphingolipid hydroxylase (fatty acid hydroxylase superfamily)